MKVTNVMKYFLGVILFAVFVASLANSTVKLAKTDNETKKGHRNNVNYNYYAGPNTMKIEQQLAEMKEQIRALVSSGLFSEVKEQLTEMKQEISAMKSNQTGGSSSNGVSSEVKQQLADIKQEIKALKENQTAGCSGSSGLFSEVKQQLAEIKQEIKTLKENQTSCSGGKVYKNCAEVYKSGNKISGVYKINPDGLGEFEVYCDQKTAGGGWTVFQKRMDGSVDFYRGWDDYKRGFGNLNGEYWLGLEKIHRLTVSGSYKLRLDLEDFKGKSGFAEYSSFGVTNERAKYQLSLGSYSGTAGDSLGNHRGMAFTTKDRDNDKNGRNCALDNKGAWWYNRCYHSNLNGLYLHGKISSKGMVWYLDWNKNRMYIVKRSEMKIRPKDF